APFTGGPGAAASACGTTANHTPTAPTPTTAASSRSRQPNPRPNMARPLPLNNPKPGNTDTPTRRRQATTGSPRTERAIAPWPNRKGPDHSRDGRGQGLTREGRRETTSRCPHSLESHCFLHRLPYLLVGALAIEQMDIDRFGDAGVGVPHDRGEHRG